MRRRGKREVCDHVTKEDVCHVRIKATGVRGLTKEPEGEVTVIVTKHLCSACTRAFVDQLVAGLQAKGAT